LLALELKMEIELHTVVGEAKRQKVFQEIRRRVFSLFEKSLLAGNCTYLSCDSLRELAEQNVSFIGHGSSNDLFYAVLLRRGVSYRQRAYLRYRALYEIEAKVRTAD